ncbi:MAG: radical SAM protein [Deltaproteobacteria bacterium]|jgi:radical SAM protein with 4Fe4S-binding SPASM domain|nr:radical SAM protein [Deltaproteobacteria bacterium]
MIGVSKLYCGSVEASDALRYRHREAKTVPSHLLQFSASKKPVIVWNVTRSCNLACLHCYAAATPGPAPDELSFAEGQALVKSLADFGVPVILFSGGEPLAHPHIFELIELAVKGGVRAVLSTNGLLLGKREATKLKELGLAYAGISLDGLATPHDRMRGRPGAFQGALKAIRTAREAGLKVGLRLTLTQSNFADLERIFELMVEEDIPRACFYHLVDQGANPSLKSEALTLERTRAAVDLIAQKTQELHQKGRLIEVLTVDNQADGPYLYLKLLAEGRVKDAENVLKLLQLNGGASSGHGIGAISWDGAVHPDQFWRSVVLGSTREKSFPEIWNDPNNELLMALRDKTSHLTGRCAACRFLAICGGGLRARAQNLTGDPWSPDPACYLTSEEIGLEESEATSSLDYRSSYPRSNQGY